jgi:hypothetical protein
LRCGALPLYRSGHGFRYLGDLTDPAQDRADRTDRIAGDTLDPADLPGDILRRRRRLPGERLHLGGHHREAAPGGAGTSRLDRGVQRQRVRLLGERGDQPDHGADRFRRLVQLRHQGRGLIGLGDGQPGHVG